MIPHCNASRSSEEGSGAPPQRGGEALCLGPVRERVRENVWPRIARAMRIESAALGEELPYRAALCAALEGELVEAAER